MYLAVELLVVTHRGDLELAYLMLTDLIAPNLPSALPPDSVNFSTAVLH